MHGLWNSVFLRHLRMLSVLSIYLFISSVVISYDSIIILFMPCTTTPLEGWLVDD